MLLGDYLEVKRKHCNTVRRSKTPGNLPKGAGRVSLQQKGLDSLEVCALLFEPSDSEELQRLLTSILAQINVPAQSWRETTAQAQL